MNSRDFGDRPGPGRVIVGGAIVALGALILVPSGLCSTFLGIGAIFQLLSDPAELMRTIARSWPFFLALACAVVAGIVLIRAGLAIGRKP